MSNATMATPLRELEKQGKARQLQAEKEAARVAAWTPPTTTWAELMESDERFRANYMARINSFSSDNLTLFHANRHSEDCECLTLVS